MLSPVNGRQRSHISGGIDSYYEYLSKPGCCLVMKISNSLGSGKRRQKYYLRKENSGWYFTHVDRIRKETYSYYGALRCFLCNPLALSVMLPLEKNSAG
jgi:hypothetical protein